MSHLKVKYIYHLIAKHDNYFINHENRMFSKVLQPKNQLNLNIT